MSENVQRVKHALPRWSSLADPISDPEPARVDIAAAAHCSAMIAIDHMCTRTYVYVRVRVRERRETSDASSAETQQLDTANHRLDSGDTIGSRLVSPAIHESGFSSLGCSSRALQNQKS